jgi:hypothetical protein
MRAQALLASLCLAACHFVAHDDNFTLDFAAAQTAQLSTPVTSGAKLVRLQAPATVDVTAGTIVLNGADTGQTSTLVHDGDAVAIRLVSPPAYGVTLDGGVPWAAPATTTSTMTLGAQQGTFTLTTAFPPPAQLGPPIQPAQFTFFEGDLALTPDDQILYVFGRVAGTFGQNAIFDVFEVVQGALVQRSTAIEDFELCREGSSLALAPGKLLAACGAYVSSLGGSIVLYDL